MRINAEACYNEGEITALITQLQRPSNDGQQRNYSNAPLKHRIRLVAFTVNASHVFDVSKSLVFSETIIDDKKLS